VTAALRKALAKGTDLRLGPLDAVRDFIDARNVADAVLAAVPAPAVSHPVLNIASGWGVSARTLVKELLTVSGATCAVYEDEPGSARSADVPWQQAVITQAEHDLGWAPRHDLAAWRSYASPDDAPGRPRLLRPDCVPRGLGAPGRAEPGQRSRNLAR
jgi:nucleoside-diphosphate-sugar epimerase